MYKPYFLFVAVLAALTFATSCEKDDPEIDEDDPTNSESGLPLVAKIDSTWEFTAGRNYPLSLNNHHFTFSKNDNDTMEVSLSSADENVVMYLYSTSDQNDPIRRMDNRLKEETIIGEFSSGDYILIVGARDRGKEADYTLEIRGGIDNVKSESSQSLAVNPSANFEFGGRYYKNGAHLSPRNEHYRITVDQDNDLLDINAKCGAENIYLWLLDDFDFEAHSSGYSNEVDIVREVDKGEYTVILASIDDGNFNAEYSLLTTGKISSLERIQFDEIEKSGTITDGGGDDFPQSANHDKFTLTIEEGGYIDFMISSSDYRPGAWIFNQNNDLVYSIEGYENSIWRVLKLDPGVYDVYCGTDAVGQSGDYNLSLVGKIKSLD